MDIANNYDYSQGQALYNLASNIYRNNVPLNARMLVKGAMNKFYNGGQRVDENYLTPQELNYLRKAWKQSVIRAIQAKGDYFPAVTYQDYDKVNNKDKPTLNEFDSNNLTLSKIIKRSYSDPAFVASTSIGKSRWYPQDNDEIVLTDTYDFIQGLGNYLPKSNYAKLHTFGEKFTAPYPVNINIGNPRDWWNKL